MNLTKRLQAKYTSAKSWQNLVHQYFNCAFAFVIAAALHRSQRQVILMHALTQPSGCLIGLHAEAASAADRL